MSPLRVGLTGGLASGKSTVGRWLSEAGCEVVDSDRIVAELYRPGGPGARVVEALFGAEVLNERGGVDRTRLAERVFADGIARRRLEQAIHPLVRDQFARIAADSEGITVLEVPLLVESGMAEAFDVVVTIESPPEERVARAVERGLSAEEARARIAAQVSPGMRRNASDIVIENDGDLDDLRREVDDLVRRLEALAAEDG
ncbi:MAG: dephospho-CoA kinase [Thermoanaerobaculia bacterium]|nr:dephospho-CoA kinase [Thermoanaerobaculia bacterium]